MTQSCSLRRAASIIGPATAFPPTRSSGLSGSTERFGQGAAGQGAMPSWVAGRADSQMLKAALWAPAEGLRCSVTRCPQFGNSNELCVLTLQNCLFSTRSGYLQTTVSIAAAASSMLVSSSMPTPWPSSSIGQQQKALPEQGKWLGYARTRPEGVQPPHSKTCFGALTAQAPKETVAKRRQTAKPDTVTSRRHDLRPSLGHIPFRVSHRASAFGRR
jgi:hypothetical protein